MKYIIKKCPALYRSGVCNDKCLTLCEENTDCLLKQIVEKCKLVAFADHCSNCDGCGYFDGCGDYECGTYQANEILQMLEIEEIG